MRMTENRDLFWELLEPEYTRALMFCRKFGRRSGCWRRSVSGCFAYRLLAVHGSSRTCLIPPLAVSGDCHDLQTNRQTPVVASTSPAYEAGGGIADRR